MWGLKRCAFIRLEIVAGQAAPHVTRLQTPAATLAPRLQGRGRYTSPVCLQGAQWGCHQSVTSLSSNACQRWLGLGVEIMNSFNAKRMLVAVAGAVAFARAARAAEISGAGAKSAAAPATATSIRFALNEF